MNNTVSSNPHLLVVDDELDNLVILESFLLDASYVVDTAKDGKVAWDMLTASPQKYDLVLLDWMMPNMDGIQVLENIQNHNQLYKTQVIMQTARARPDEIKRGIAKGAWYYLTKPFSEKTLLDIVKTAIRDQNEYRRQQDALQTTQIIQGRRFVLRTLEEARNYAVLFAKLCPEPSKVVIGFTELLVNAIEHGNLGISYDEKSQLLSDGMWEEEVLHRLSITENVYKTVEVFFDSSMKNEICFLIRDQGNGFDWNPYTELSPERATHTHGRGIFMANSFSFDRVKYHGIGNEVSVYIKLI